MRATGTTKRLLAKSKCHSHFTLSYIDQLQIIIKKNWAINLVGGLYRNKSNRQNGASGIQPVWIEVAEMCLEATCMLQYFNF